MSGLEKRVLRYSLPLDKIQQQNAERNDRTEVRQPYLGHGTAIIYRNYPPLEISLDEAHETLARLMRMEASIAEAREFWQYVVNNFQEVTDDVR